MRRYLLVVKLLAVPDSAAVAAKPGNFYPYLPSPFDGTQLNAGFSASPERCLLVWL